jgi:hypothetical protein
MISLRTLDSRACSCVRSYDNCCRVTVSKTRKADFKRDCARVEKRPCQGRNPPDPSLPAPLTMGPRWFVDGTCGPTQRATSLQSSRPLVHTSSAGARIASPSRMVSTPLNISTLTPGSLLQMVTDNS